MKRKDPYLLSTDRRHRILETVNERRSISVDELVELFPVSSITIRRDLDKLASEGMLRRVHGGAMALPDIIMAPRASEQYANLTEEQIKIGKEASKRIAHGNFIIIESGSTCIALVRHLTEKKHLKIVTVSPRIVMLLADLTEKYNNDFEIISSGGILHVYQNILSGPHARSLFESIRVDMAFVSVTAIDIKAGITADSVYEAEITRTILEKCSKKNIGLIYSSKFNKSSFIKVSSVDAFDEIITDSKVDQDIIDQYTERGVKVTCV